MKGAAMKKCPVCGKIYGYELLRFCRFDGVRLVDIVLCERRPSCCSRINTAQDWWIARRECDGTQDLPVQLDRMNRMFQDLQD
jgi:hypothetical protein